MKKLFYILMLLVISTIACQTRHHDADDLPEQQIADSLKNVAISFLRSWEPPFNPGKALSLFTQSDDFHLVIDGFETGSYKEWAEGVPDYMADDNYFFTSYKHEIKDIRTVVLSPKSGVVTMTYVWDNVSKEGIHKKVDGASTMACRFEDSRWKIVHYHGSHGEEKIIN